MSGIAAVCSISVFSFRFSYLACSLKMRIILKCSLRTHWRIVMSFLSFFFSFILAFLEEQKTVE